MIQQHSDNPYYDSGTVGGGGGGRYGDSLRVTGTENDPRVPFSDYTYYESLASQQQCQISCCLIAHPPEVPPTTVCEWSDVAVGAPSCGGGCTGGVDGGRWDPCSSFKNKDPIFIQQCPPPPLPCPPAPALAPGPARTPPGSRRAERVAPLHLGSAAAEEQQR